MEGRKEGEKGREKERKGGRRKEENDEQSWEQIFASLPEAGFISKLDRRSRNGIRKKKKRGKTDWIKPE